MKVCMVTLGCKVNEYESESMATALVQSGYEVCFGLQFADIFVLNTCAVTNMAERKSRQYVAKINKINPLAKIVVCGCASQNNNLQFNNLPNVYSVFGNEGKNKIVEFIDEKIIKNFDFNKDYTNMLYATKNHIRQYIKIQDGCNYFCSYCLIPYLRGRSRSRSIDDIKNEIKNCGASEIVLTGINVSDYKVDGKHALGTLIEEVDKMGIRFRLSSIEVNVFDDAFINILKNCQNFCPHFHISLQSACDATLKRMNRRYDTQKFIETTTKLKTIFPSCCISTDLIVGFCGETDDEFEQTKNNLQIMNLDFLHIFPYSERNGTVGAKMPNKVDKELIAKRVKIIEQLNEKFKSNFYKRNVKTQHKILIEEIKNGDAYGYTENYIYCKIKKCSKNVADIIKSVLDLKDSNEMIAEEIGG